MAEFDIVARRWTAEMRRTLGICAACEAVLTVSVDAGRVRPVGTPTCPQCGGNEFAVLEVTESTGAVSES